MQKHKPTPHKEPLKNKGSELAFCIEVFNYSIKKQREYLRLTILSSKEILKTIFK